MSKTRFKAATSKLGPEDCPQEGRTLWRCVLRIGTERDEFLFRGGDEFEYATIEALRLVDESPSCKMVGAVIVAVERVSRLWN